MDKTSANKVVEILQENRDRFLSHLKAAVEDNNFNYRTFGTEIEDYIVDEMLKVLKEEDVINGNNEYKKAMNKNEFPELVIYSDPTLGIEVKSGNHSKKKKGEWVTCKNSNNDMGTLNRWEQKINEFGGDNIYYVFIEYNFNDDVKEIIDIKIEPFYKFLGIGRSGLLKYREKDGNLRPKDFNAPPPLQTFDEFRDLLENTNIYRSKRIIKKHYEKLPTEEKKKILQDLE